MKFLELAQSINLGLVTFPVAIPAKGNIIVYHTQEQYNRLAKDIAIFAMESNTKYHAYLSQIQAATSVDEVNVIQISF